MRSFEDNLKGKLAKRTESGLLRMLKTNDQPLIDFASNDYLGLASSMELREMISQEIVQNQFRNGSTGSRLLTGNSAYAETTESLLASVFQSESTLVFNSGYSANLAVLSSLPTKNDTILYDELAHASIKDGARLGLAKKFSFRHNDCGDLEAKIRKSTGEVFIAIESVYSMDGDETPLADIVALAKRYGCVIILDEAHSTGVMGPSGSGLAVDEHLHSDIQVRIYTFGKAMGIHGACVAGSNALREFLINFARPFIYTTAPDPHSFVSIRCAFQFLQRHPELQSRLRENVATFLSHTASITNRTASESAIQTVLLSGNETVKAAAAMIKENAIDVRPILSPTVPAGKERLRICLHSFNTTDEIKKLANLLEIISGRK